MDKETTADLLADLRRAGVQKVEASYYGNGDEGWLNGVDFTPPSGDGSLSSAELTNLTRPVEDMMWDAIESSGHAGFENNEGGEGTLLIDVVAGTFTLDHSDNYEEQSRSATRWDADGNQVELPHTWQVSLKLDFSNPELTREEMDAWMAAVKQNLELAATMGAIESVYEVTGLELERTPVLEEG